MSNHTIRVPLLGQVTVTEFSNGVVRTPKLEEVQLAEKYKKYGRRYCESIFGKLLQDGDLNTNIKRFWEENFDTCIQQLFTEKVFTHSHVQFYGKFIVYVVHIS